MDSYLRIGFLLSYKVSCLIFYKHSLFQTFFCNVWKKAQFLYNPAKVSRILCSKSSIDTHRNIYKVFRSLKGVSLQHCSVIPFIISFEVYSGNTHYFANIFSFPDMGENMIYVCIDFTAQRQHLTIMWRTLYICQCFWKPERCFPSMIPFIINFEEYSGSTHYKTNLFISWYGWKTFMFPKVRNLVKEEMHKWAACV